MIMVKRKLSLIKIVYATIALSFCVCFVLIFIDHIYMIKSIREQSYRQLYSILDQQNQQIEEELSSVQSYLTAFAYSAPELNTISRNEKDTNYYIAVYRQKTNFSSFLTSSPIVDGLAAYSASSNEFIQSTREYDETDTASKLREIVRKANSENTLSDLCSEHWYPMEMNGRIYLVICLRVGSNYLFSWTRCSKILSKVHNYNVDDSHALLFAGEQYYTIENLPVDTPPKFHSTQSDFDMVTMDQNYLSASVNADYMGKDGSLMLLIPDVYITSQLQFSYLLSAIAVLLLIVISLATTVILHHHLTTPINQLLDSIHSLRDGNFGIRLPNNTSHVEFQPVNDAFNDMVVRIEGLKINVYEEQLKQQKIQSSFLRSQITPHFFINCLNVIYHLAAQSKTELVQIMTVKLGRHLRYTLSDRSFTTLRSELEEVADYVAISNLRYADAIELHVQVSDPLMDMPILPMILVTQVENTVKYAVIPGEQTHIYIEADEEVRHGISFMHLQIWDSGIGWSEENLALLNNGEALSQELGHHIGIQNTTQRMKITYAQNYQIRFSNHPQAGAQIEYWFPTEIPDKGGSQ